MTGFLLNNAGKIVCFFLILFCLGLIVLIEVRYIGGKNRTIIQAGLLGIIAALIKQIVT